MKLPVANLQTRLVELGLSVKMVHAEMNRRGFDVKYSTVAGWLNGSRGIREMQHLRAICDILQRDLDALSDGQMALAEQPVDVAITRGAKVLPDDKKELVLALIRSLSTPPT